LSLRHEFAERGLPPPLYARIMGAAFDRLPPAVRRLHDICRDSGAEGEGRVERGRGLIARAVAAAMRFPPEGLWPLHVAFAERGGTERWTRDFGGHRFASELSRDDGRIVERFGPLRFAFELPSGPEGLEMRLRAWSVLGIPLPLGLAPRIGAREWEEEGRFRFAVTASLPLIGEIVRYSGWLVALRAAEGDEKGRPVAGPPVFLAAEAAD
jgi:hypothetical protein